MIGNNIGNPIGGIINVGGASYAQSVTANMTWAGSAVKNVGTTKTANFDFAASITKAVDLSNNPIVANMTWAGVAVKAVAISVVSDGFTFAGSVVKDVGKIAVASMSWVSSFTTLIQNFVDTTILQKPVDAILAKAMRMKKDRWEFERMPGQGGEKVTGKASGVGMLRGDPPSFTTTTKKL